MVFSTKKLKVAITSLYRNSSENVEENMHHIKELSSHFGEIEFYCAENNSIDNTYELIKNHSKQLNSVIFKIDDLDERFNLRTERLAYLHNLLIKQISNVDYVITVDSDGILKDFKVDGLLSCFEYDWNSWDMMGANSNQRYYDIWALRSKELDYDCWDMVYHKTQMGMSRDEAIENYVRRFQVNIPKTEALIQVESCFGGLAVYKFSSIKNCLREGKKLDCDCKKHKVKGKCIEEVCEHVAFHKQMIRMNNAKLFINPNMMVNSQDEHLVK